MKLSAQLTNALEEARQHHATANRHRQIFNKTGNPADSQAFAFAWTKFRQARITAMRLAVQSGTAAESVTWEVLDDLTKQKEAAA